MPSSMSDRVRKHVGDSSRQKQATLSLLVHLLYEGRGNSSGAVGLTVWLRHDSLKVSPLDGDMDQKCTGR